MIALKTKFKDKKKCKVSFANTFNLFLDAPIVLESPQNLTVTEATNVSLRCNVTARPTPIISWIKQNSFQDISAISRFKMSANQLFITDVHREDAGNYLCVAKNSEGKATSNPGRLKVDCK